MFPVSLFACNAAAISAAAHSTVRRHIEDEERKKEANQTADTYGIPKRTYGKGQDPIAVNVATYIVHYSLKQGDYLHRFKLHKLMYFVQAVSMLTTKKPMFNAKIEAWDAGPFVPDIYDLCGKFTCLEMSYCGYKYHPETWVDTPGY